MILTSCDGESIVMANNAECKSIGKGTMKIKMFDGVVQTLKNVMHVPYLKKNLISCATPRVASAL